MRWQQLCTLGKQLPEVAEDRWYGTPALTVRGKGFVRLKDDATAVFMVDSVDEQEGLCAALPDVYYITDHYVGYAAVLARLAKLTAAEARVRLERAWLATAPKSALAKLGAPGSAVTKRSKVTTRYRVRARKPAK